MVSADSERMAASPRQRRKAADALRAGGTQTEAAAAAGMNVSTIKRWLDQPAFQAIVRGSPDIRAGRRPRLVRREMWERLSRTKRSGHGCARSRRETAAWFYRRVPKNT